MRILKTGVLLVALIAASLSFSQDIIRRANTQVGTVQALDQIMEVIVISGREYRYETQMVNIFFEGMAVEKSILGEGMVIRYLANNDSLVVQIELLGPIDRIQEFFEH